MNDQLDIFEGRERRDIGISRATEHADRKSPKWTDRAIEYVKAFPFDEFQTEEVRLWAHDKGLPEPPHKRAWGGVMARAAKLGIIVRIGFKNVKNPRAHCTPAAVWKKAA